jgi:hypothetical protein
MGVFRTGPEDDAFQLVPSNAEKPRPLQCRLASEAGRPPGNCTRSTTLGFERIVAP